MHRVSRLASLITLLALGACTTASGRSGMSTIGGVRLSSARPTSAFVADLSVPAVDDTTVRSPTGRLSLTFRSHEHFEFDLILRDGGSTPWVAVWITRAGTPEPVATIVSGIELRGAYSQLRGTGVLPSADAGPTLLERLRSAPGQYQVRVTSGGDSQPLTGSLAAR